MRKTEVIALEQGFSHLPQIHLATVTAESSYPSAGGGGERDSGKPGRMAGERKNHETRERKQTTEKT